MAAGGPYLFPPEAPKTVPIVGERALYPVRRIFCVGRNYAAHAAEMGGEVDREAPWYFLKSPHGLCQSGQQVPYPPGTKNYHHEVELVVALATPLFRANPEQVEAAVFGYGVGLDMTRRDRQQDGKDHRRPWDLGKDIENGAVIGALTRSDAVGTLDGRAITLTVQGELRQKATLDEMVWSVPELVHHLSHYYHLGPGDLIMTGTPAGVSAVEPGQKMVGEIAGLAPVEHLLGPAE